MRRREERARTPAARAGRPRRHVPARRPCSSVPTDVRTAPPRPGTNPRVPAVPHPRAPDGPHGPSCHAGPGHHHRGQPNVLRLGARHLGHPRNPPSPRADRRAPEHPHRPPAADPGRRRPARAPHHQVSADAQDPRPHPRGEAATTAHQSAGRPRNPDRSHVRHPRARHASSRWSDRAQRAPNDSALRAAAPRRPHRQTSGAARPTCCAAHRNPTRSQSPSPPDAHRRHRRVRRLRYADRTTTPGVDPARRPTMTNRRSSSPSASGRRNDRRRHENRHASRLPTDGRREASRRRPRADCRPSPRGTGRARLRTRLSDACLLGRRGRRLCSRVRRSSMVVPQSPRPRPSCREHAAQRPFARPLPTSPTAVHSRTSRHARAAARACASPATHAPQPDPPARDTGSGGE